MEKEYNLSYVITTRNKLSYLKWVMTRLLDNIQKDEEIVVIDGSSVDGTVEYLQDLHQKGLIQQFVSEVDYGEAHGYNKGVLLAKGLLIKLITDDDVFYYPGIQKCKKFMLENSQVDILGTNGLGTCSSLSNPYVMMNYVDVYQKWSKASISFAFCGLGLMLRKSSLSYIGLFNPAYIRVDAEYTMRMTSLKKVVFAWYTGSCWIRMANPQSNSIIYSKNMYDEERILNYLYLGETNNKKKDDDFLKIIRGFKKKVKRVLGFCILRTNEKENNIIEKEVLDWGEKYLNASEFLENENKKSEEKIFLNKTSLLNKIW